MIDWNEIEKKIKTISIFETFETHLDPRKMAVIRKHAKQMRKINSVYSELLKKISWTSISKTEETLLIIIYTLFLTEGLLGFGMNMIIYALMLKGHHDIWFEWKQRFVSSFDELFEVRLSVRLKFLEKHEFEFFSEICPKDIRDTIAHLNFDIGSDGTICIKQKKKYTKEQLETKIFKVVRLMGLLGEALE